MYGESIHTDTRSRERLMMQLDDFEEAVMNEHFCYCEGSALHGQHLNELASLSFWLIVQYVERVDVRYMGMELQRTARVESNRSTKVTCTSCPCDERSSVTTASLCDEAATPMDDSSYRVIFAMLSRRRTRFSSRKEQEREVAVSCCPASLRFPPLELVVGVEIEPRGSGGSIAA